MKMAQKVHDANQFRANVKSKDKAPSNKIVMDIAPGKLVFSLFLFISLCHRKLMEVKELLELSLL